LLGCYLPAGIRSCCDSSTHQVYFAFPFTHASTSLATSKHSSSRIVDVKTWIEHGAPRIRSGRSAMDETPSVSVSVNGREGGGLRDHGRQGK